MSTLDIIANSYGTDKSSFMHNYAVKYEKYLPFKRYDKLKMLEIGVLRGESLKAWKDYFYRSEIIGIDIMPECKKYEENRIIIEIGSQVDEVFLNNVSVKHGPFDMILDDGSHMCSHQIYSFEHLFASIKSGGVYVVEDAFTSYWPWFTAYGIDNSEHLKNGTTIDYFKKLIDDVNFRGLEYRENQNEVWYRKESNLIPYSQKTQPSCRVDIESINFLNGIIIITKR